MKRTLYAVSAFVFIGLAACSTPTQTEQAVNMSDPAVRDMPLDEFLQDILSIKIPLRIAVPDDYIGVRFKNQPLSSYWMKQSDANKARQSNDLPTDTDWLMAEISQGVAYDKISNNFVGIDYTNPTLRALGFKTLGTSFTRINGYPVAFIEVLHVPTNKPIYMMYVATLFGENVVMISYRAPANNRVIGDKVWKKIKIAVSAG
jgi:hypothetical protein